MNKPQVASILSLKTRHEYIHVALLTASLLSTVLKNSMETTLENDQPVFRSQSYNLMTLE